MPEAPESMLWNKPAGEDKAKEIGDGENEKWVVSERLGKLEMEKGVDGTLTSASRAIEPGKKMKRAFGYPRVQGGIKGEKQEKDGGDYADDNDFGFQCVMLRLMVILFFCGSNVRFFGERGSFWRKNCTFACFV